MGTLARLLRLASLAICLIAVAWFVAFALEQTSKAAAHQQAEVNGVLSPSEAAGQAPSSAPAKKSGLRETIDSAFTALSAPFSGVTAGTSSQWKVHIVDTLLALLIYGLGLGFIARVLRLGV